MPYFRINESACDARGSFSSKITSFGELSTTTIIYQEAFVRWIITYLFCEPWNTSPFIRIKVVNVRTNGDEIRVSTFLFAVSKQRARFYSTCLPPRRCRIRRMNGGPNWSGTKFHRVSVNASKLQDLNRCDCVFFEIKRCGIFAVECLSSGVDHSINVLQPLKLEWVAKRGWQSKL